MFENTEDNYKFILILWSISLTVDIILHRVIHYPELTQMIRDNTYLVPQIQMIVYSAYVGLYLYISTRNNLGAPKYEKTTNNLIKIIAKSSTTISIVYIDLIMITVLMFSFFTAGYGINNNIPYNWHALFLHVIAPLLALWMNYNLRNQKIKLRDPE